MYFSDYMRGLVRPPKVVRPTRATVMASRTAPFGESQWVTLGGTAVKLMAQEEAIQTIIQRASTPPQERPLAVASANLDHIKHFGFGNRWAGILDEESRLEWLTLLDGAPLVAQANSMTSRRWPRLAGSDLIEPILDAAELHGIRVGFLGGTAETQAHARERLAESRPMLRAAGWWTPDRETLHDPAASELLAGEIAESGTEILVVCLGKPRQELWISEYGRLTGANVLLAFGAVIDFLAGRVRRAPDLVQKTGMEWAWRLALEPRRLAGRYLVDGPEAYLKLRDVSYSGKPERTRVTSALLPGQQSQAVGTQAPQILAHSMGNQLSGKVSRAGRFQPCTHHTDVAVVVVTYCNEKDVMGLLQSLRAETSEQSIKVIVADNSPTASTLSVLASETDVLPFSTGGNYGYSAGINLAMSRAGTADSYLILNPDVIVERGAISILRARMSVSNAGAVVPSLHDEDGSAYPSLRREPTIGRAVGDALFGGRVRGRPTWLAEMDFDSESYHHPHVIDWATGAALLVRADVAETVGSWDEEFFLYSEETDFFRRIREIGCEVWFEPSAHMQHRRGGSGSSPQLTALMAVNRIRYMRKHQRPLVAALFRCAVAAAELARLGSPEHRLALWTVLSERRWKRLPRKTRYPGQSLPQKFPSGSVVIPAHNEAAVISRTLTSLSEALESGSVEVIVACNACSDSTAEIAASVRGVRVISIPQASKAAALNAADDVATLWPRVYLDADIELPSEALRRMLFQLSSGEDVLAARPVFRYDTGRATRIVRAYYRARLRLPHASNSLWGAGIYGVSRSGHQRFSRFPNFTGDDYYVNGLFNEDEKRILNCEPVVVRTPRSPSALLVTLKRVYRGNAEQRDHIRSTTSATVRDLLSSVRGPLTAADALVYVSFALVGRWSRSRSRGQWERDESSRND